MLLLHAPGTKQSYSDGILRTTTWGRRLALLTLLMLLVAGLSFADGKKHKLSKDLEAFKGGHNGATVDVIIPFNQTPATCSCLPVKMQTPEITRLSLSAKPDCT